LEQAAAQVHLLEASLAAARLAVENERSGYLRLQGLVSRGVISVDEFETRKTQFQATESAALVSERNLAVAKAGLVVNERALEDTVIRAPFDGVVTSKNAQPGEVVSPQFLGGGGIVTVVDMDSLEVDVDI